jgi:hypothetical protein
MEGGGSRSGTQTARTRRAAGDDSEQIVPSAAHTAAVALDQVFQRNRHLLLHCTRATHKAKQSERMSPNKRKTTRHNTTQHNTATQVRHTHTDTQPTGARVVDVSRDAEQFGAGIVFAAESGEPRAAAAQNGGAHRHCFHVRDGGRAAVQTHVRREWRLQTRLTRFALQTLQQTCTHTTPNHTTPQGLVW